MMFVYSPDYFADIGQHVFPIAKYRLLYDELVRMGHLADSNLARPEPATREQVLQVHTKDYLADLEHLRRTSRTIYSELPLTAEIVRMSYLNAGGTICAARLALEHGAAVHIGGGFHHAFADRAEGFCYLNDLAVAVREMQGQQRMRRAMVIDCDLHQGNGTAKIFAGDPEVFTFSIHQWDLYPAKEKSDLDIHLPNGTGDREYLEHLDSHLPSAIAEFKPELILYQAGADPFEHDLLGDLQLTFAGLQQRDRFIYKLARQYAIPMVVTLGGGYAVNTHDTVRIHYNTCVEAIAILGG